MYIICAGCRWWENKGDVWRLLQDMAVTIDGRTWPAKDEAQVDLLHHVLVATLCVGWICSHASMVLFWALHGS